MLVLREPHEAKRISDNTIRSLVEIRFTALGNERTRVELTQSNWEAFGEIAKDLRGGYGGGWSIIFEQAYQAACGG